TVVGATVCVLMIAPLSWAPGCRGERPARIAARRPGDAGLAAEDVNIRRGAPIHPGPIALYTIHPVGPGNRRTKKPSEDGVPGRLLAWMIPCDGSYRASVGGRLGFAHVDAQLARHVDR